MSAGIQTERQLSNRAIESRLEIVNPLERPNWDALVAAHSRSTVFHGSGWARVLAETYGHIPVYVCRFDEGRLVEALPLMEVSSWLTGRRGVSLPFTDSCAPICETSADCRDLYQEAMGSGRKRKWKYLECRDYGEGWENATPSLEFYGHVVDLTVGVEGLFKRLVGSMRNQVRKAEASGLKVEFGIGEELMRAYFKLHCATRQKHGVPPQPWRFFENIQRHILSPGRGFIVIVRLEDQPAAAGVFFTQNGEAMHKFGASDIRLQKYRPNNLMMWAAMRRCAEQGLATLNLGRTSLSNNGLRHFKLGLGAAERKLQYAKYEFFSKRFVTDIDRAEGWFNRVFSRMPLSILRLAGASLYPHLS